ncbi:STAS domain-containing protein [Vibrio nigripulchritudo]|uniref:STAS domain-containing protein n=1 Tax=Vibrio nigripulchritudo TaxID=28173 RepID=UPI0024905F19|nr:STAS domain-containing protein [Vibrio nigripulchritudo]BDU39092.1 sulfate transporter [Vibrio nigripulchritudo]BDU44812.1 sulfate transporter [Vibrio nigripulchritudo]
MECQLEESLEIGNVLNIKNEYQQWLDTNEELMIDASSVVRVDAAGLQALASLFFSAKQANTEIKLINASDEFQESIKLLDLQSVFEN